MSKRSVEYGREPDLKRQRERGDYQHLTKVIRDVLTNNLLRKNIMKKVSEIHSIILSENEDTITGKQLDNIARLSYLAYVGATTWCAKEYLGLVESSSLLNHSLLRPHLSMVRELVERSFVSSTQKDLFNKLVDPTYTPVRQESNEKEEQYIKPIKSRPEVYLIAMSRPHDQLDELVSILNVAKYSKRRYESLYSDGDEKNIPMLFKDRIGDKMWEEAVLNIFKTYDIHLEFFSKSIAEVAAFCAAPKLAHFCIKGRSNCDNILRDDRWKCKQSRYVSLLKYCTPGNEIYNPLREMVLEKCFRVKHGSQRHYIEKLPYHYFEHASFSGILEFFRLTYIRGAELVITATVLRSLKNSLVSGNLDIINFIIDYINSDYAHIKGTNDNDQNNIEEEEERSRERIIARDGEYDTEVEEKDSTPTHIDEINNKILSVGLIDRLLECEALSDMFKCTFKKVLKCAVQNGNAQVATYLISIADDHEFQFDYKRVFELCFESKHDTSRIVSLMIKLNLSHPNDVPEEIHQHMSKEVAMALACSKPKPPLNADIVKMCVRRGQDVMEALCTNGHVRDDIQFVNDRDMICETFCISFKVFSMFRVAAPVLARMEHKDDRDIIHVCLYFAMNSGDQESIDYIIENYRDELTDETIHEYMNNLLAKASIDTIIKYVEKFGKFKPDRYFIKRAAYNNEDVMMYALACEPSPQNVYTAIKAAMKFSDYSMVISIIDTYGNQYPDKVSGALGYDDSFSQGCDPKLIEYIFTSPNSPYINGYHTSTFTTRTIIQLFEIALSQTYYKITKVLDKIYSNRLTTQLSNNEKKSVVIVTNDSMLVDIESTPTPSRMDQVFHLVFRNSKLATKVMEQIASIHESLGFKYLTLLDNDWHLNGRNEYHVTKGKIVYNSKSLISFIRFGCTQWFIEEYEKLCSFEMYPYNELLLEAAINYKNTTIIDKLLSNSNMTMKYFNGMWKDSMLELGYHEGLIQEFKMTIPIKHESLLNAMSSGSLKLIKYLVDNKLVLSEESKENADDIYHRYNRHRYHDNKQKWILNPCMYDMVLLIKQHGLCTGKVNQTLLLLTHIRQSPLSLFDLLYQGVELNENIEYLWYHYQPDKMLHILKQLNTQEIGKKGYDKDEIHRDQNESVGEDHEGKISDTIYQDNFRRILMKAVDKGPSEVIDWAMSKCSSNLEINVWVDLFKLALKRGNHEILQMAYTKSGQNFNIKYNDPYSRVSKLKIHPCMLKQEVFTLMGMPVCNPHIINSALDNDREDIIQEALNNPEHLNKSCACINESSRSITSMLLNAIRRGRRDIVDWIKYNQKRYDSNKAFEESLKKGDLDMAKLFVDDLSNYFGGVCGSTSYNYISGCAKNLGRMELSDLGKVTLELLIEATRFEDTSITEDLIISVLESGVKISEPDKHGHSYINDANSAYNYGMMKLVRCILKDKKVDHPFEVTHGRPPMVRNPSHEVIEYYIKSRLNVPVGSKDMFDNRLDGNLSFTLFLDLFDLTLKKYGSSSRGCPNNQLENLRTDQLNVYKKCISILHQLNENKQTVEITKIDIKMLIKDHFEFIPMLLRDDILWTSCLQPSKDIFLKVSFEKAISKFNAEGIKFFWNYLNEIKSSSPTLHKQIGILSPFDQMNDVLQFKIDDAVKFNHHEFFNEVFNHPNSPLYHKKSFNKDSTIKKYLNVMKSFKKDAYKYGNIHIIYMCNNIINYFNRDIQTN